MALNTSEFGRALEAVSDGKESLDGLLTILTREDGLGTEERSARLGIVRAMRDSGRLSDVASAKVVRTIFQAPDPVAAPGTPPLSVPAPRSHPSNWSEWAENQAPAAPLKSGSVLRDRFVLEEVIGIGGMSNKAQGKKARKQNRQGFHEGRVTMGHSWTSFQFAITFHVAMLVRRIRDFRRLTSPGWPGLVAVWFHRSVLQ